MTMSNHRISDDAQKKLDAIKQRTGASFQWIINKAIEMYFESLNLKLKEK